MADQDLYALTADQADRIRRLLEAYEGGDHLRPLDTSKRTFPPGPIQTYQALVTEDITAANETITLITTLNGAINSSVTTVPVNSIASFPVGVKFAIRVESEYMIVTSAQTAATVTVSRGFNSTAASHVDTSNVEIVKLTLGSGSVLLTEAKGDTDGTYYADESDDRVETDTVYNITGNTFATGSRIVVFREPFSGLLIANQGLRCIVGSTSASFTFSKFCPSIAGENITVNLDSNMFVDTSVWMIEGQTIEINDTPLNSNFPAVSATQHKIYGYISAIASTTQFTLTTIDTRGIVALAWYAGTTYVIGDEVIYDGILYTCKLGHTNHVPPNGTYWNVGLTMNAGSAVMISGDPLAQLSESGLSADITFDNGDKDSGTTTYHDIASYAYAQAWDVAHAYLGTEYVSYSDRNYYAYLASTGTTPGTAPLTWQDVTNIVTFNTLNFPEAAANTSGTAFATTGFPVYPTSQRGVVTTGTQSFKGKKGFIDGISVNSTTAVIGANTFDGATANVSGMLFKLGLYNSGSIALNAGSITGTIPVSQGGTSVTSFTPYCVVTGGTSNTGALQTVSTTGNTGEVLTSTGASSLPTWQASGSGSFNASGTLTWGGMNAAMSLTVSGANLAAAITGTLTANGGGTGVSSLTAHGVLIGEGTNAVAVTDTGNTGEVLTSNGNAADPTYQTLGNISGGASIAVATINGGGTLTQRKITGNVSAISRTSQGVYRVNFASNYSSINEYSVSAITDTSGGGGELYVSSRAVNTFTVTLSTNIADVGWLSIIVVS